VEKSDFMKIISGFLNWECEENFEDEDVIERAVKMYDKLASELE